MRPPTKGKTMETRAYYYGDGTENIVHLTEEQARVTNDIRITEMLEDPFTGEVTVKSNLSLAEMEVYNEAADLLNKYIETHDVYWNDQSVPMIRPVL